MTKAEKYERVHHITNRPFAEELRRLIDSPPLGSVPMDITPAMATEMLKRNTNNRPLSEGIIKKYARQMMAGEWHRTPLPIIFSKAGRLIDGQHRLAAIVLGECVIATDVAFGTSDAAFAFIDVGKKRSPADVFSINGVANSSLMASAMARVINIQDQWSEGMAVHRATGITPAQLYGRFQDHPDLPASAPAGHLFHRAKLIEPALAAALHYLCAKKSRPMADKFFSLVADGIGFTSKNNPAARLRDRLISNMGADEKLGLRRKAALIVKAWNAHRDGRSVGVLKFGDDEAYPRIR